MGIAQWMRVVDAVSGLAQLTGRFRRGPGSHMEITAGGAPLEARLAGVVVAALKEAFDRDRTRLDLEREQIEAERRRAEQLLHTELRRQAAERAVAQMRLIAGMAIATWMLSAALAVWLPGMRAGLPRTLLGGGWTCAFGALGCAFAGWQTIASWGSTGAGEHPRSAAASAAPALLLLALALTASALLVAL